MDGIDPVDFGVALSQLPANHPLVVAAALAVETSHARHQQQTDHAELRHDLSRAADWAHYAAHRIPYADLHARRAQPAYPPGLAPADTTPASPAAAKEPTMSNHDHRPAAQNDETRPERVSIAEVTALTRRLRQLSNAGPAADPAEREAFLADKAALLDRITHDGATPRSSEPATDTDTADDGDGEGEDWNPEIDEDWDDAADAAAWDAADARVAARRAEDAAADSDAPIVLFDATDPDTTGDAQPWAGPTTAEMVAHAHRAVAEYQARQRDLQVPAPTYPTDSNQDADSSAAGW